MKAGIPISVRLATAFFVLFLACIPAFSNGLRFTGLEQSIGCRTSFDVFGGRSKVFRGEVNLDFDVYMYPEADARFGYLFRIIEEGVGKSVWNLSYSADGLSGPVVMRFNEEGNESLIVAKFDRADFPELKWVNVGIGIDLRSNVVRLTVGDRVFEGKFAYRKPSLKADIIFGVNGYIIDVPAFALRNLRVSDSKWEVCFPFTESEGKNVHDSSRKAVGRVVNPNWMVYESSRWSSLCKLALPHNAGYGYDEKNHRFYYFDKDSLFFYSVKENSVKAFTYSNKCPMNIGAGDNFLSGDRIVVYEPCGHMRTKRTAIATLDLETFTWTPVTYNGIDKQVFHHTGFYNPVDSAYCIFGGYGNMMYNGEFYSIDRDRPSVWERKWENCTELCPRYFVSSGTDGEKAYFFGGMGNSSGEQVVGRRYFYDFHCLDMRTGEMRLIWTLPQPKDNYVPVRSMIIDGGFAYILCYPEYKSDSELSLHRMRLSDGEDTILDDTVYICSNRLLTNAMLYLDKEMEKLFVVTQISRDDISSTLDIYQINWPVLFDTYTYEDVRRERAERIGAALILLILISTLAVVLLLRRRSRTLEDTYKRALARRERKNRSAEQPVPNTVRLFGQFEIIDANGNNLSYLVNGQQRDIFLLIAKYSNREGISSERLSKIIWPDKDLDRVKNSRGVAINKLRASLSGVRGLSIAFREGSYKLLVEDVSQCDYLEFYQLTHASTPDMDRILSITARGGFLAFTDNEIFDSWKSGVEEKTISLLHEEVQSRSEARDWAAVMEIVDILFAIDPIDEQALHFAIHCLKTLRHSEEARIRYADFTNEYRAANGEEYPVPFGSL